MDSEYGCRRDRLEKRAYEKRVIIMGVKSILNSDHVIFTPQPPP
jgi:hypothetical protein